MVSLVLFDIDGTLIHTGGAGVKAFAHVFAAQFGLPHATEGVKFAGRTDRGIVSECFLRHGIAPTPENFDRFFDAYVFYLDWLLGELRGGVHDGVASWLAALPVEVPSARLGLLTGNIRLGAELKLRHYQLWQHFEIGGFGDREHDRNCVASAAKAAGETLLGRTLRGDEILVIGDTPLDVACAQHIGARTVGVATGPHTLGELRAAGADWAVRTLHDLPVREACG